MKVINKVGFNFTLPVHLCPYNIPITIPFDGRVYDVPDAVYNEKGLQSVFVLVEPPRINYNQQIVIPVPPKIEPIVEHVEAVKQEIKEELIEPNKKRRGPRVKINKPLGGIRLKKEVVKKKRRSWDNRIHYTGDIDKETKSSGPCDPNLSTQEVNNSSQANINEQEKLEV